MLPIGVAQKKNASFEIPVVITNPDGSKITKTVEITVLRDTDGDGDPDITDTDDDGDGVPDTVETAKGSDPKNANSRPAATITPIAQPTITTGISILRFFFRTTPISYVLVFH